MPTFVSGQPSQFVNSVAAPLWSATYESGTWQTYFNGSLNGRTDQTCSVSLKVTKSPAAPTPRGRYSAFYYKKSGASTNDIPCQWAEHEVLGAGLTNYVQQLDVMVPSHLPNGARMTLADWQSFETGHLCSTVACVGTDSMYGVDSNPDRTLHLWVQGQGTHQSLEIPYPLDKWFTIATHVSLDITGGPDSRIEVYLNDAKIASWTGRMEANLGLWRFHNGLYVGSKQSSFSLYNDNDYLWAITPTVGSTTSSAPTGLTGTMSCMTSSIAAPIIMKPALRGTTTQSS